MAYADTAGNIFVNFKNIFIHINTGKTNRSKVNTNTSAFTKSGLKVIYQFLIHPDYINKPYRFIGAQAMVTIATVGTVFKDLLREKYIVKSNEKEYQSVSYTHLTLPTTPYV